jgi:hypothetical protein
MEAIAEERDVPADPSLPRQSPSCRFSNRHLRGLFSRVWIYESGSARMSSTAPRWAQDFIFRRAKRNMGTFFMAV